MNMTEAHMLEAELARTDIGPYEPKEVRFRVGDTVCYVGDLYPENHGKLLDVTAIHDLVWVTPRRSELRDHRAPLPGIGENDIMQIANDHTRRFAGPGETCCVYAEDLVKVA